MKVSISLQSNLTSEMRRFRWIHSVRDNYECPTVQARDYIWNFPIGPDCSSSALTKAADFDSFLILSIPQEENAYRTKDLLQERWSSVILPSSFFIIINTLVSKQCYQNDFITDSAKSMQQIIILTISIGCSTAELERRKANYWIFIDQLVGAKSIYDDPLRWSMNFIFNGRVAVTPLVIQTAFTEARMRYSNGLS